MDNNVSANTQQGAAGQSNDFEIHPIGTAERLRQLGIVGARAAEIMEGLAQDLKDSETINGEWPEDDKYNAHAEHDEWLATAGYLRALCATTEVAPADEKPAFPPDDDVTVYPWPSVDD